MQFLPQQTPTPPSPPSTLDDQRVETAVHAGKSRGHEPIKDIFEFLNYKVQVILKNSKTQSAPIVHSMACSITRRVCLARYSILHDVLSGLRNIHTHMVVSGIWVTSSVWEAPGFGLRGLNPGCLLTLSPTLQLRSTCPM